MPATIRTERNLADDTTRPGASRPPGQRTPPVIDLSAEEVRKGVAPPGQAATSYAESSANTGQRAATAPEPAPRAAANPPGKPDADRKSKKISPEEAVIPSAFAGRVGGDQTSSSSPKSSTAQLVAAAIGGGVVAAILVLVLGWLVSSAGDESGKLASDVAALQSDVAGLRQESGDSSASALEPRLTSMEQALEALRAESSGSDSAALDELRNEIAALQSRIGQIAQGGGDPELQSDLENSAAEIEALRQEIATLTESLGATNATAETALAIAPAVAADALADALQAGTPFAAELDALRGLGLDEEAIAGLEPYAGNGLATLAELRARFEAVAAGIDVSPPPPEGTGVMERLLESAGGLIEVRPANPVEGAEPAAVLARMRGALEAGDLSAALAEWSALPDDAKGLTADWARDAEARLAADQFVARIRSDALSRLGGQG